MNHAIIMTSLTGLGIYTKEPLPKGVKFGPFAGTVKTICEDASSAWEVSYIVLLHNVTKHMFITKRSI